MWLINYAAFKLHWNPDNWVESISILDQETVGFAFFNLLKTTIRNIFLSPFYEF